MNSKNYLKQMEDLQKLVDEFSTLKSEEEKCLTFLEITKCSHSEDVWNNVLAFYIDPNNEHNLYELMLKSIFETANKKIKIGNLADIRVETEYVTVSGFRIGILVFAGNFLMGIECIVEKMMDSGRLQEFSETVDSYARMLDLPSFKIILSGERHSFPYGIINIVYSDLINIIRNNIPYFYSGTKYFEFFEDFLLSIENTIDAKIMDSPVKVYNFFTSNSGKMNQLLKYHNKWNMYLLNKLETVHAKVKQKGIRKRLDLLNKRTRFEIRPGKFVEYEGKLIAYNIVVGDLSLFLQVKILDYKLVSHYWFGNEKYHYLTKKLEAAGVAETTYEHDEHADSIAFKIMEQLNAVVTVFEEETNKA